MATEGVQSQPGLHETLSQEQNKTKGGLEKQILYTCHFIVFLIVSQHDGDGERDGLCSYLWSRMVQASHRPWNSLLFHFLESHSIAQCTSHQERGAVLTSEETCSQWEEVGRTEKGGKKGEEEKKEERRGEERGQGGEGERRKERRGERNGEKISM